MRQLQKHPRRCHEFTGICCFPVLEALYNYFNARGVLERCTYWHGSGTRTTGDKDVRGRRAVLTPFEAYVLFHVVLWKGMSSFVPYIFGVCYATANRVFRTMLRIVAYIGGKHQPYPVPGRNADVLLRESTRAAAAERGHCHFQR